MEALTEKERKEFFDRFTESHDGGLDAGEFVVWIEKDPRRIYLWVESLIAKKMEEQYLVAFHEGYQTRCDEDEYEPKKRTMKALKAMERRAKVYRQILDSKIEVNHDLNI